MIVLPMAKMIISYTNFDSFKLLGETLVWYRGVVLNDKFHEQFRIIDDSYKI